MSSRLSQRLGWRDSGNVIAAIFTADPTVALRTLIYLLGGVGTVIMVSGIPGAPLHGTATLSFGGLAYVAAFALLFWFDRVPRWVRHLLLLGVTALISWAVYESGVAGSPYKVFYFWVAVYAAFFMTPTLTGLHIAAMLAGYIGVLIALGSRAHDPSLHAVTTGSALIIVAAAIQVLNVHVRRLVDRLTEISRSDSLTGLYDSPAFTSLLDNEIERARRSGNRLGVVLAEIEGVAPLASGPPPAAQQRRLAAIGEIFREKPRQIDMAARLGGGRFALLLPYTDEHGGYLLAERLRTALGELGPVDGERIRMSFGVAGFPRHGASAEAVFQGAETALGEAKDAGGDRVMLFQRSTTSARVEIAIPEELMG